MGVVVPKTVAWLAVIAVASGAFVSAMAPARADVTPPSWTCGFSNGLEAANPPAQLRAGTADIYGAQITIGPGPIDWLQNSDYTVRLYLQSLKWLEPLITSGTPADLVLARSLVAQWAQANPVANPADDYGWTEHAVGMRATTLACLRAVGGANAALDAQLTIHVAWLSNTAHYAGAWNHGLFEDVGLVAAACAIGDDEGVGYGKARTEAALPIVIDADGGTNEQAPGYAGYVYDILSKMRSALNACSEQPLSPLFARVDLIPTFMAFSVRPDGKFAALGDTVGAPRSLVPGSPLEYAASLGTLGTPPSSRLAHYAAGFAFSRSGWGTTRPFTGEDFWTLRYGPGRIIHGHNDHTSITTWARGRSLLVDSGFSGYGKGAMRDYLQSPQAHNMTVVPGLHHLWESDTVLTGYRSTAVDETLAVKDQPYDGVTRIRTVFASHDVPITLTVDRSTSAYSRTWDQLWHVHPDMKLASTGAYGTRFISTDNVTLMSLSSIPWPGRSRAALSTVSGKTAPYQGWFAEGGAAVPAPVTTFRATGKEQLQIALSIASRPGARVSWSMKPYGRTVSKLTVTIDGKPIVLHISSGSGWIARQ